jgi:hypothetical protein
LTALQQGTRCGLAGILTAGLSPHPWRSSLQNHQAKLHESMFQGNAPVILKRC